jgi:hypothetical protein
VSNWQDRPDVYSIPAFAGFDYRKAQRRALSTFLGSLALGLLFLFIVALPLVVSSWAWVVAGGE